MYKEKWEEKLRIRLNSAQFELNLPVGAELGKTKAAASDSELNSSIESVHTQVLSLNSDKCERMSPLEEFNTLHRHCAGVRRSIKVNESSIV